jgi:signal transduction histidine kinase
MPVDEDALTSPYIRLPKPERPRRFVSLRWKVLLPIIAALMAALMCGVYGVSFALVNGEEQDSYGDVELAARSAAENALDLGRAQRTEVDRIAFTKGVSDAIFIKNGAGLQTLVEPLAALANLDLVLIGDIQGAEVIGLQRVIVSNTVDYEVVSGTDLQGIQPVQQVLNGAESSSAILSVERRPMLITAGPVLQNGQLIGVVVVGTDASRALNQIKGGGAAELTLFGGASNFLGTTFDGGDAFTIQPETYQATLSNNGQVTFETLDIGGVSYQTAYLPFVVGQTPLGVLAVYQPEGAVASGQFGRQVISLFAALIVAVVCITGYWVGGRMVSRVERVTAAVDRMTAGEIPATGLKPHDELGELGAAVDRYAAAAQVQVRHLQADLRQQRRQLSHMNAVLDSLKDGVVVQDMEGRVMTMNSAARNLLGAYGDTEAAAQLRAWSATLRQMATEELAPGITPFWETAQLKVNDRILEVRAAAVESITDKRVGTVITLRDVTADMAQQAQRDALIDELANNVHASITRRTQAAALTAGTRPQNDALSDFAREISQDARAMQRLITDYRDLTLLQPDELRQRQHPVNVVDLLISLVEDWRPTAQASNVDLQLHLPDEDDLYVLGDEKRLLWAFGNVLDNAIKYSGGRGQVTLTAVIQMEHSRIKFVVQDQGVGISETDLPHVFTRFYRGNPLGADGVPLLVPGTGQGLYLAQRIIEAHGGNIGLVSAAGQGTQVSLLLPLTAEVGMVVPPAKLAESTRSIWDEPTNREIVITPRKQDESSAR